MNTILQSGIILSIVLVTLVHGQKNLDCNGKQTICIGPLMYKNCTDNGDGIMVANQNTPVQNCPNGERCVSDRSDPCSPIDPPTTDGAATEIEQPSENPSEPSPVVSVTDNIINTTTQQSTTETNSDLATQRTELSSETSVIINNDIPIENSASDTTTLDNSTQSTTTTEDPTNSTTTIDLTNGKDNNTTDATSYVTESTMATENLISNTTIDPTTEILMNSEPTSENSISSTEGLISNNQLTETSVNPLEVTSHVTQTDEEIINTEIAAESSTGAPLISTEAPPTSTEAPLTSTEALITSTGLLNSEPTSENSISSTEGLISNNQLTETSVNPLEEPSHVTQTDGEISNNTEIVAESSTGAPLISTEAPPTSTEAPLTSTEGPITSTGLMNSEPTSENSISSTEGLISNNNFTETSADQLEVTSQITQTEAEITNTTETSAKTTEVPLSSTEAPLSSPEAPITSTGLMNSEPTSENSIATTAGLILNNQFTETSVDQLEATSQMTQTAEESINDNTEIPAQASTETSAPSTDGALSSTKVPQSSTEFYSPDPVQQSSHNNEITGQTENTPSNSNAVIETLPVSVTNQTEISSPETELAQKEINDPIGGPSQPSASETAPNETVGLETTTISDSIISTESQQTPQDSSKPVQTAPNETVGLETTTISDSIISTESQQTPQDSSKPVQTAPNETVGLETTTISDSITSTESQQTPQDSSKPVHLTPTGESSVDQLPNSNVGTNQIGTINNNVEQESPDNTSPLSSQTQDEQEVGLVNELKSSSALPLSTEQSIVSNNLQTVTDSSPESPFYNADEEQTSAGTEGEVSSTGSISVISTENTMASSTPGISATNQDSILSEVGGQTVVDANQMGIQTSNGVPVQPVLDHSSQNGPNNFAQDPSGHGSSISSDSGSEIPTHDLNMPGTVEQPDAESTALDPTALDPKVSTDSIESMESVEQSGIETVSKDANTIPIDSNNHLLESIESLESKESVASIESEESVESVESVESPESQESSESTEFNSDMSTSHENRPASEYENILLVSRQSDKSSSSVGMRPPGVSSLQSEDMQKKSDSNEIKRNRLMSTVDEYFRIRGLSTDNPLIADVRAKLFELNRSKREFEFECKREGNFPDLFHNTNFYMCKKIGRNSFRSFHLHCPPNTHFNLETKTCI